MSSIDSLKECKELGIYFVTILGGEPLVYPHLFEIIEAHPDIFFQVHINAKGDVEPCVYTHIATDNIRDTTLFQALNSDLFRDIRSRQPHNTNHLRPCMIIDNPQVMRDVIQKNRPYFTHPGAEEIYTNRAKDMDHYADTYACLADMIWREEYEGPEESEQGPLLSQISN